MVVLGASGIPNGPGLCQSAVALVKAPWKKMMVRDPRFDQGSMPVAVHTNPNDIYFDDNELTVNIVDLVGFKI